MSTLGAAGSPQAGEAQGQGERQRKGQRAGCAFHLSSSS